jgi:hypothetical protein
MRSVLHAFASSPTKINSIIPWSIAHVKEPMIRLLSTYNILVDSVSTNIA